MDVIEFVVGGVRYPIFKRDIAKHPDSFLAAAIKRDWHNGSDAIVVNRDGELFRIVHAFLVTSRLPAMGESSLQSLRKQTSSDCLS